jgi:hypothetical protein
VVGQPLLVQLVASDPEDDPLTFSFSGPAVPDLATTASITVTPAGQAIFTFTPLASQIGLQVLDLSVSDGRDDDHVPLFIDVRGASGSGSMPVFRSPLGAGTVLDLDQTDCVELDIEIDDPDSAQITLEQAPPLIEGASLSADFDGRRGTWSWCPDRRQVELADHYTLYLVADDGDNPAVTKEFVIVLRRRKGGDCPGQAPVIEHAPMDVTTRLDLPIVAEISDDQGLGSAAYVVYATEDPGDPIDFTKTTLVTMELTAGDMLDGTWRGLVPNSLANEPDGASGPIFYLVSVTDDDDLEGDCDHRSDDPSSGMHRVTVTAGGDATAGLCEPCSFDVQCGDEDDLCLPSSGGAGGRCGQGCAGDDECEAGYVCSAQPIPSIEGQSGRQCIPNSGSCGATGGDCEPDDHEPDDTPDQALAMAPLDAGTLGGRVLCEDEDWYALALDQPSQVTASLEGDVPPDMDLSLTTEAGVLLESSDGLSSSELVEGACLDPGTYLLRVYSIDSEPVGSYTLDLQLADCGGGGGGDCCVDNDGLGCNDPVVQACVCALDDYCCATEWDNVCAGLASSDCEACGGGTQDDCCTAHATPGCADATIETCVCAVDAFCCDMQWDATCVSGVADNACGSCP